MAEDTSRDTGDGWRAPPDRVPVRAILFPNLLTNGYGMHEHWYAYGYRTDNVPRATPGCRPAYERRAMGNGANQTRARGSWRGSGRGTSRSVGPCPPTPGNPLPKMVLGE